jgi:predicted HTH domain antitoxin
MTIETVSFEINISLDVYLALQAQGLHRDELIKDSRRFLALHYYADHVLSLGKTAKLAGLNLWDFTAFLSQNNVPVIDLDADELAAEYEAIKAAFGS